MSPRTKRIAYGLYTAAVTLLFLYVLFPAEALRDYLAYRLAGGTPRLEVTLGRVAPVLPAGLRLQPVRYEMEGRPVFELERLTVRPRLFSLLRGAPVYTFDGTAHGGRLAGEAGPFDADTGRAKGLALSLEALRLEDIPALRELVPQKVSGRLGGRLTMDEQGRLSAELKAAKTQVAFTAPVFGLEAVTFDSAEARMALAADRIELRALNLKGAEMNAEVSGNIRLDGPMTLDLRGSVSPHHTLLAKVAQNLPANLLGAQGRIGFTLSGPAASPAIAFEK